MIKRFRAWDGKEFWYANDNMLFIKGFEGLELSIAPFDITDVDAYINKVDMNGAMIYENDIVLDINRDKLYQIVWSDDACGFRKVPYGQPLPETKIDVAFIKITGTIYSQD